MGAWLIAGLILAAVWKKKKDEEKKKKEAEAQLAASTAAQANALAQVKTAAALLEQIQKQSATSTVPETWTNIQQGLQQTTQVVSNTEELLKGLTSLEKAIKAEQAEPDWGEWDPKYWTSEGEGGTQPTESDWMQLAMGMEP